MLKFWRMASVQMPKSREVIPGTISANNSECFLCSVRPGNTGEHIGGPGNCETKDQCEGDNPVASYQLAQKQTDMDLAPELTFPNVDTAAKADLPDTWLLLSELVVYCRSTDPNTDDASITSDCLTREYVQEVIKGYITMETNKTDYAVAVAPAGIHGATQNFTDEALVELQAGIAPA